VHAKVSKEYHGHGKYIIVRLVDHTEGPRCSDLQENVHVH